MGYISGWGNHAQLDSAYLTRRNSQTSQLGPGKRPRMYTMQTARAVEDPCVHAEIRWSIPTQTFHQITQQPLTLQARPTCSRRVTVASSDWQKLLGIIPSIWKKLGKTFSKSHFYCKDYRINTEWRTLKEKASVSPFYGLKVPYSGPSSFKLATSGLIFGDKNRYGQTTVVILCY